MPEIANATYRPIGEATRGHKVFLGGPQFIPAAELAVDTTLEFITNMVGTVRQAWIVAADDDGAGSGGTVEVAIDWSPQARVDDTSVRWFQRQSLGVASINMDEVFEHHSEDVLRWTRLRVTPRTAVPSRGIYIEVAGRVGQPGGAS